MLRIAAQGLRRFSYALLVIGLGVAAVGFRVAIELDPAPLLAVVVAVACGVAAVALTLGGMRAAYPPLRYDPGRRLVHLGTRRIPASSIVAATRRESVGARASYLSYRLQTDRGRRIRVLVTGRPFPALDVDGLAALRQLVADTAIIAPEHDGLTEAQRAFIASLDLEGGDNPVGRPTLLRELDQLIAAATLERDGEFATAAGAGSESVPGSDTAAADDPATNAERDAETDAWIAYDEEDLARDEEDARRLLVSLPTGPRRLARVAGWVSIAATGVSVLVIGIAAAREAAGAYIPDDEDALIGLGIALPLPVALVAFFVWAGAADIRTRRERAVGDEWLAAEPRRRQRGLPWSLQRAWHASTRRLPNYAAFALAVLSGLLLVAGVVVLLIVDEAAVLVGVGLLLAGTIGAGVSELARRAARRASHTDRRALALRMGTWLAR